MSEDVSIGTLFDFLEIVDQQNNSKQEYKYEIDESNEVVESFKQLISSLHTNDLTNVEPFVLQHANTIYNLLWYLEYKHGETNQLFFRGNSKASYLLAPGTYRNTEKNYENYYFKEMQVRCSLELTQNSLLDKLVYLQHYGCPTRLLDITSNPLVALFFSCCDDEDDDGAVFCFKVKGEDMLYPNSDRAQMLSHLCEFKPEEQDSIMTIAMVSYAKYKKHDFKKDASGRKYTYNIIERLYHSIKRETAAFDREMKPFDLLRPAFVQAAKSNPRIIKQDGAFIISGLAIDEVDCDDRINKYVSQKIIIKASAKKTILKQLEQVGICAATLFPEVDKVAEYLKNRK